MTGAQLSKIWEVPCKHALFRTSGDWYHRLLRFPGAYFDAEGYVLFQSEEEFLSSPFLQIAQNVHVPMGIRSIPGYVHVKGVTPRKPWTRSELLVLMNLYAKIPFGQFDQSNPVLMDIADRMGRTPGSVAMKLSNLASLDPVLQARGIKGLTGASALDRAVWEDFQLEPDAHAVESEHLLSELMGMGSLDVDVVPERGIRPDHTEGPTESEALLKVRRGQAYFRQVVLNAYGGRCAVTGLAVRELLVASHIVPWAVNPDLLPRMKEIMVRMVPPTIHAHRLDVRNGIALNGLHDRAFDRGFITFDKKLRMVCCKELRGRFNETEVARNFKVYEGKPLHVPEGFEGPNLDYLAWHREWEFRK